MGPRSEQCKLSIARERPAESLCRSLNLHRSLAKSMPSGGKRQPEAAYTDSFPVFPKDTLAYTVPPKED